LAPDIMMAAPVELFVRALNHVLENEDWARQRLGIHAGQTVRIEGGPFAVSLTVGDDGMFCAAAEGETAAVAVEFSSDAPFRLLSEHGDIFAAAHLTGSATFAETLAFVFRNLRWDVEADLADIVGDIPARRIARAATAGLAWHRAALARLGANVAEFASEESRLVVPARELAEFASSVDMVRDDLARLEKRIARLP
jgi:ubiquinone biosynthesis accessory factor UbiJ